MNKTDLHSSRLESLLGEITCELISQEGDIRKVHLRDANGISKTLGIVRFATIKDKGLQQAHRQIVNGELLGKTLFEANIDFKKSYLGHAEVMLPAWLRKDFDTSKSNSIALCSRIYVNSRKGREHQNLYAEVVEVIPPSLKDEFLKVVPPLTHIEEAIVILFDAAGIRRLTTNRN
jgi:hypothetical protein